MMNGARRVRRRSRAKAEGFSRAIVVAVALAAVPILAAQQAPDTIARVDAVFSKYSAATPGCAVGVAEHGKPTLAKGYGSADLEHDVRITPETIFEGGSVSKQFTAASVLLLARDGKLSLDDPARKYIPELPDYGKPLTIRHMLNHTSGLRDWGSVAAIGGWPRTTRVHTHANVLEIVSRQESLNFPPGSRWSYTNTGFNLAAVIVERVSGQSFQEFTRARLFGPLGMTHTSWRDDYTRVVKGRAIAYDTENGEFHTDMPFENVYGNGGILTTVGDLLKWNENFAHPVVGDAAFVELQQQPGRFNDGRPHGYAFGLSVESHNGLREVAHSGSTAGYSAFLTRFPDQQLSVAVLCNVATNATMLAHEVADVYLPALKPEPASGYTPTLDERRALAGMYRRLDTGMVWTISLGDGQGLRLEGGRELTPVSARTYRAGGDRVVFDATGTLNVTDQYGTVDRFERVAMVKPTAEQLRAYVGAYASRDADVEMTAKVEGDRLVLWRRPATTMTLTPLYADAFRAPSLGTVIFRRDANGRVVEFSVVQDRVWNMPFHRIVPASSSQRE
jgi:CubicO group peptidase (beta-lactamase class C family)